MAAGGASLVAAVAVFSMLIMSSLGQPRPSCNDCMAPCNAECNEKMKIFCGSACSGGARESCRRAVLAQCTARGTCCSSNGTCTCDCMTVAGKSCMEIGGFNPIGCHSCQHGIAVECYPICYNNCKKIGCEPA
ncbi:hypothetical protein ZWY2020_031232 [Hordeum vulgare]|nr:hypothetical protein ZWY2020_031232 [Hordeum vulgare]